jgi:hypothetical protein
MCKHPLYEQNGRSKLFNLDFVWVTLEYGLFFLNCYEWCIFPFTQWSVDIILSKEPVFFIFYYTRTLFCQMQNKVKVEQFAPPILLVQWMFTHVNNGITIGMWGKTQCFDVQCKLSRNSMNLSHSVNRVDSQLQPELGAICFRRHDMTVWLSLISFPVWTVTFDAVKVFRFRLFLLPF